MTILRLAHERGIDQATETDVRGLEDPGLFQNSRLSSRLEISGKFDLNQIKSVCDSYQLEFSTHRNFKDRLLLQERSSRARGHKLEALSLFYAALEVYRHSMQSRCLIFQVNLLRSTLGQKLGAPESHIDPQMNEVLIRWHQQPARFSLHAPIALYLMQAGVINEVSFHDRLDLSDLELNQIHSRLSSLLADYKLNPLKKAG